MTHYLNESHIEEAALEIFEELGYQIVFGPDISRDGQNPERQNYLDVILTGRLKDAIDRLNPDFPEDAKDEAVKKLLRTRGPRLDVNNKIIHKYLTEGIDVEYRNREGRIINDKIWPIDFENPENNEFLAVNQFSVIENNHNRRPDIVVFVNGIPIAVIELKNPSDENATIWSAFNQIQTYKSQIPTLFHYNEIVVISDGIEARSGTISSDKERFMPWKTIDGVEIAKSTMPQMEVLIKGIFEKRRLLDILRHFIVFEKTEKGLIKKAAAYHQYHAVNKAISSTIKAAATKGDRRAGVIWHTQGSGKSLIMVFYTGKLVLKLDNPTVIMLTDRNDLDSQLFETFCNSQDLLRQEPVKAESRDQLKELLKVASGGIVFTTIQKFFPEIKGEKYPMLSDRKNIIVIADEAHRSQYDFIDGFARNMRDALPNASFIGFTGTPIEKADKNTPAVFGDYIDIYDIERAVNDGATVKIYYESRLAKLELKEEEKPKIDGEFEEVTEFEEEYVKESLKTKWARVEAIVGSEKRIKKIAEDIVDHFEERLEIIDGKGMIVCMSRRICVELYNEIIKLRPRWHNENDEAGFLKVIMTGSATDPVEWQEQIRNKQRRQNIAKVFKNPSSPIKLAIVRDMWLTGFDAPCLHTMYVDKPMRGHGLMQAIARVNRVFKDKPGGLIVDYIGIAGELKSALIDYTESGGKGKPTFDKDDAVKVMLEKYEIIKNMLHGYEYKKFFTATVKEKMTIILETIEHILNQDNGRERFIKHVVELSKAFALAVPHVEALKIRDELAFFQAVKAAIAKSTVIGPQPMPDNLDSAIRQIVSKAVSSDQIIDIFDAAGLKKPDISILSDEFLDEIRGIKQKNVAIELLKKLLNDEIKIRTKKNLITGRSFAELLEKTIKKYQNKTIETAIIIEELIELAKKMRESLKRGEKLKLNDDELAFYDALEVNDSAVKVLGDETLKMIARELVETIRKNVKIDWTLRESIQAAIRLSIKKILRKYGYPPDKQQKATDTVLEQATIICKDWAENN